MRDLLAPLEGESSAANRALHDYAALALTHARRSLRTLHAAYQVQARRGRPVPTKRLHTLEGWSSRWQWQQRVRSWDALWCALDDPLIARYTARELAALVRELPPLDLSGLAPLDFSTV